MIVCVAGLFGTERDQNNQVNGLKGEIRPEDRIKVVQIKVILIVFFDSRGVV